MPKIKTRKSVKKRFKITKSGKVVHARSGKIVRDRRAKKIKRMLGK